MNPEFKFFPGADIVEQGLLDLQQNRETIYSLLVCIGAPRMQGAGLAVPSQLADTRDLEIRLYQLIGKEGHADPYSHYNSLIRRLIKFEQALEEYGHQSSEDGECLT